MMEPTARIQQAKQQLHATLRKDATFEQKTREALEIGVRCLEAPSSGVLPPYGIALPP